MKRVAGTLTYANVMSTLAVFLVLGGGITLAAISGNGSVKFGAEKGFPEFEWETVLSVPGVGKVQGFCSPEDGEIDIRFKNMSSGPLEASAVRASDGGFETASLAQGESLATLALGLATGIDTLRFHVIRASAVGQPTADLTVSYNIGNGGCSDRAVAAQAVASE